MLLILPPSEGKTAPEAGPRLKVSSLSHPALRGARTQVREALIDLCATQPDRAIEVLGLGPTQRGLVDANAKLAKAPCAPTIEIYTGVLYEALDFASLRAPARKRADSRIAIASALFGLLTPGDFIPAYRLSGDTALPGLGGLASIWRPVVQAELEASTGVVLDMRSGVYSALAPIPPSMYGRSALVRVLVEKNGRRSVVSHHNKATKGRLARAVLNSTKEPRSLDDVEAYVEELGFACELDDTTSGPRLDVIITHI